MKRQWILVVIGFSIIGLTTVSSALGASNYNVRVSYFDVGQGDSILIRDKNGFDVLIDGGKPSAGPTVVAYIHQMAIDDIDVLIASHADADHIGGLIDVLHDITIPVNQVLYNGYPGNTNTWYSFATAVAEEGLTLDAAQFPQEYSWGVTTA